MPNGSTGKILHVNLTKGRVWKEVLGNELYRLFPGGNRMLMLLSYET